MQSTEPDNTATDFREDVADLEMALLRKDVAFWIEQSDTWKRLANTERDRADRAEALLAEVKTLGRKITGEGKSAVLGGRIEELLSKVIA